MLLLSFFRFRGVVDEIEKRVSSVSREYNDLIYWNIDILRNHGRALPTQEYLDLPGLHKEVSKNGGL